jgi:hypothetical protein
MLASRTLPPSFRSPLDGGAPALSSSAEVLTPDVNFRCQCGAVAGSLRLASPQTRPLRCHCARCRRYHTSAFAALLEVPLEGAGALVESTVVRSYGDQCATLGDSRRLFCGTCRSKVGVATAKAAYLAMGVLDDARLGADVARRWQVEYTDAATDEAAPWWTVRPQSCPGAPGAPSVRAIHGACACGACAFIARSGEEFQLQHCYCGLCRRLSGSVAQTWVPVRPEGFEWTRRAPLQLVRTTGHGCRHQCGECGGVLSIVYDSQPDCIWPVAGAIDDDAYPGAPSELAAAARRVIHICCGHMQPWYSLPDDRLPRLRHAG